MLAIPPQLVQQLPDVRARLYQDEQHRLDGQNRDDGDALLVLEDDGHDLAAGGRLAEVIRRNEDGGDPRRQILDVESLNGLTVDQEAVSTEHDGCFNSLALAQSGYQIADARHGLRRVKCDAKLRVPLVQVKHSQSLELVLSLGYRSLRTPYFTVLSRTRMYKPRALLVAVAAVAAIVACGDVTAFKASIPNDERSLTVYAMNGTSPSLPSAVSVRTGALVRIDPTWQFDLAFDMDDFGFVTVRSVKAVASELSSVNRVGFRLDSVHPYDEITVAPTSGFAYDTSVVLLGGRVLLIDVIDPSCQGRSFLGFNIRAKLKVDSIDIPKKSITFRMLRNPNCGFKGLTEGLPKE